jgi:cell division protein FtsL
MLKLLLCLCFAVVIAVVMLHLRQQRLELDHQANLLHNKIEAQQAKLWNQQLQIAVYTAPNAISKTVGDHSLKLVPRAPLKASQTSWIDARGEQGAAVGPTD